MLQKNSFPFRILLLLVYGFLILIRLPENPLTGGHILAEDGTVFLSYAWHADFWQALFHPFAGYLNLTANVTGIITSHLIKNHFISIYSAPLSIQLCAFIFQLCPAILILWGNFTWLPSRLSTILALGVIAFCPKSDEVWLHGMHIQFWLGLCCALILLSNTKDNHFMVFFKNAILCLSPLSGPTGIFIGPLFFLRSCYDRSIARFSQTVILGFFSLIQILFFYKPFSIRTHGLSPEIIANATLLRGFLIPIIGPISREIGSINIYALEHHSAFISLLWHLESFFSFTIILALIVTAIFLLRNDIGWAILISLMTLIIPLSFGALLFSPIDIFVTSCARRYTLVPIAVFGFMLIALQNETNRPILKKISYVLVTLYFISGISSFLNPIHFPKSVWTSNVQKWEKDHNYRPLPLMLPYGVDLSDTPIISCSKFHKQDMLKLAPSYCEENWIASIQELLHKPLFKEDDNKK